MSRFLLFILTLSLCADPKDVYRLAVTEENAAFVRKIQEEWKSYFADHPSDSIIVRVVHGDECILTPLMLQEVPQEMTSRIHVITLAPPFLISRKTCGSIAHFTNQGDPIAWSTMITGSKVLFPHPRVPLHGHPFDGNGYEPHLKRELTRIMDKYENDGCQ